MSVKGESGESKGKSSVSRAKESLITEGDDTLLIINHLPSFPIVGGALRNLELMI
jgi:hypothetical protein